MFYAISVYSSVSLRSLLPFTWNRSQYRVQRSSWPHPSDSHARRIVALQPIVFRTPPPPPGSSLRESVELKKHCLTIVVNNFKLHYEIWPLDFRFVGACACGDVSSCLWFLGWPKKTVTDEQKRERLSVPLCISTDKHEMIVYMCKQEARARGKRCNDNNNNNNNNAISKLRPWLKLSSHRPLLKMKQQESLYVFPFLLLLLLQPILLLVPIVVLLNLFFVLLWVSIGGALLLTGLVLPYLSTRTAATAKIEHRV